MFVDFKCSTLNIQVRDNLNPMENSVPRFSVSCFHSVKSGLTKHFFASVNGVLVRLSTVQSSPVQSSPVHSIPFQSIRYLTLRKRSLFLHFTERFKQAKEMEQLHNDTTAL